MLSVAQLLIRFFMTFFLIIVIDWYVLKGLFNLFNIRQGKWKKMYWAINLGFIAAIIGGFMVAGRKVGPSSRIVQWMIGLFVLSYVPKIVFACFVLLEDFWRLLDNIRRRLFAGKPHPIPIEQEENNPVMPRRKFISNTGFVLAALPFAGVTHGIIKGGYNYQVREIILSSPRLPDSFNGFRIAQISDIHTGSLHELAEVERGLNLLQMQKPDLILFTGDLVNNLTKEVEPFMKYLSRLQAPYGIYSILGNHDYGLYSFSEHEDQQREQQLMFEVHRELGWHLLRNQHAIISKQNEHISIIGVENWGLPPFPQFGDLDKALDGLNPESFKILLSHDPTHWDAVTIPHPLHIDLTLSGHTHGMQFGIEIGDFKWSPVSLRYPRWAGLYKEQGQYLYVNRGFGFIGFPGRIGIFPEITIITLQRGNHKG